MAKYVKAFGDNGATLVRAGMFEVCVLEGTTWKPILAGAGNVTVDLYDVLMEENLSDVETTNHVDTSVAGIIAPGTGGTLKIKVKNFSEVEVYVTVTADPTAATGGVPVDFDGDDTSGPTLLASALGETTAELKWKWDFYKSDPQDSADTTLGVNQATYSLPLTIKAEQRLPY
ncbi:MAG: hypothetical protein LBB75_04695 [Oscillospiraceae bacterium]|jgi:hypothetical protein|nr:hypothetical protein [Oscillospiraceae bacterium]